jgi:hypothetical protein
VDFAFVNAQSRNEFKPRPHEFQKSPQAEQAAEKVFILSFRAKRGISPWFKPNKRKRDSSLRSE